MSTLDSMNEHMRHTEALPRDTFDPKSRITMDDLVARMKRVQFGVPENATNRSVDSDLTGTDKISDLLDRLALVLPNPEEMNPNLLQEVAAQLAVLASSPEGITPDGIAKMGSTERRFFFGLPPEVAVKVAAALLIALTFLPQFRSTASAAGPEPTPIPQPTVNPELVASTTGTDQKEAPVNVEDGVDPEDIHSSITVTVTADVANIRSGPGTNNEVLGQVKIGDQLSVSGRQTDSSGGTWLQILSDDEFKGMWISSSVVESTNNIQDLPDTSKSSITASSPLTATESMTSTATVVTTEHPSAGAPTVASSVESEAISNERKTIMFGETPVEVTPIQNIEIFLSLHPNSFIEGQRVKQTLKESTGESDIVIAQEIAGEWYPFSINPSEVDVATAMDGFRPDIRSFSIDGKFLDFTALLAGVSLESANILNQDGTIALIATAPQMSLLVLSEGKWKVLKLLAPGSYAQLTDPVSLRSVGLPPSSNPMISTSEANIISEIRPRTVGVVRTTESKEIFDGQFIWIEPGSVPLSKAGDAVGNPLAVSLQLTADFNQGGEASIDYLESLENKPRRKEIFKLLVHRNSGYYVEGFSPVQLGVDPLTNDSIASMGQFALKITKK